MIRWPGLLLIALSACVPPQPPPNATEPCQQACTRLRDLGCDAGATTPTGATCEQVCETAERSGYATIHPECVAVAGTCEDAERVSREGCQ